MSRAEGNPKPQYKDVPAENKTAAYSRAYYLKNREKRIAEATQYRKDHPEFREAARIRASKYWHSKPHSERSAICNERRLMQRFKRTPEWYELTLTEQGGHCALCAAVPEGRRLQVDHDHECCPCEGTRITCGECVRGLLCEMCNAHLGFLEEILKESTIVPRVGTWLSKAMNYLAYWHSFRLGPNA